MGSSPSSCKICCYQKPKIVNSLHVQIYDNVNNENNNKFLSQPNFSYLIFLQNRVKKFIKQKNTLSSSKLINLQSNNTIKSNIFLNENIITPKKIFATEKIELNNKIKLNIQRQQSDKDNEEKYETQKSINKIQLTDHEKFFPNLILNKCPKEDLFPNSISPKKYPHDNKRRKFPKLLQGEFSYDGEWKNGKRDGFGILIKKDAAKFIGYFIQDNVNGFGKLTDKNGDEYLGYWKNSEFSGVGIYTKKTMISYKGYWSKDKQDNFGIEHWPNLEYIGEYKKGVKNGFGIMYIDGGVYEGEMRGGNIDGFGKFIFNDKRRYEGKFVNNKMEGYGILYFPDGKIFVGNFKDDLPEGFGIFYTNKKIFIGFWQNMLLEGEVIIIEGNKRKKQIWDEGRLCKNLPNNHKIFFERYINDIINEKDIIYKRK